MDFLAGGDFEVKFGGHSVHIPSVLVEEPEQFDVAIAGCADLADDHARAGQEDAESLRAYLARRMPLLAGVLQKKARLNFRENTRRRSKNNSSRWVLRPKPFSLHNHAEGLVKCV